MSEMSGPAGPGKTSNPKPKFTPTPTPTPTPTASKAPGEFSYVPNQGGGKGKTDSGIKFKGNEFGARKEPTDILWNEGAYGQTLSYRTIGDAKDYLSPSVPEYSFVKSAYESWGKATYGKKTLNSFWEQVVEDAANNSTTPWNVIASFQQQMGDLPEGTGTGPSGYQSQAPKFIGTSRADADFFIQSAISSTFGRDATKQEQENFYKKLIAGQKATFTQREQGKGTGFSEDKFKQDFLYETLKSDLKKDPDAKLMGDAFGVQSQIEQYANDMGLVKNLKTINRDVLRVIKGENLNDVLGSYKEEAINLFKPLSDKLRNDKTPNLLEGLTVREALTPYTNFIEGILDKTPNTIKLTDGVMQKIIGSDVLPDMGTVNQMVRQMSEFNGTTTAKREAADLGLSFVRAFRGGA
jgi:hypothetical protein